jgi:hypothetical protein
MLEFFAYIRQGHISTMGWVTCGLWVEAVIEAQLRLCQRHNSIIKLLYLGCGIFRLLSAGHALHISTIGWVTCGLWVEVVIEA